VYWASYKLNVIFVTFFMKFLLYRHILEKHRHAKCHYSPLFHADGRTDRHMMKVIAALEILRTRLKSPANDASILH